MKIKDKVATFVDVQGIELFEGDKVAFFEVPRTKRDGKSFMSIGVVKHIPTVEEKDRGRTTLTLRRDPDDRTRYRLPKDIALIPNENEPEGGGGSGEEDPKAPPSSSGDTPAGGDKEDPKGQPSPGSSPPSSQEQEGDSPNPKAGGKKQDGGDGSGGTPEPAEFKKAYGKNPVSAETSRTRRAHFGVEYDIKTGETRRTACHCPSCDPK